MHLPTFPCFLYTNNDPNDIPHLNLVSCTVEAEAERLKYPDDCSIFFVCLQILRHSFESIDLSLP